MRHSPMSFFALPSQLSPVRYSDTQLRYDRPPSYFSWGFLVFVSHEVTTVSSKYRLPPYPRTYARDNQAGRSGGGGL